MTQLETAKQGIISPEMVQVARQENLNPESIRDKIVAGTVVIPHNINHTNVLSCGIGNGLRTKINANFGTSPDYGNIETELDKLGIAIDYKADTVMDLSTGNDITKTRRAILKASPLPVGTVPIYQAG